MDFPYGRPWLLDGATGTNLMKESDFCPPAEAFILSHPETLLNLQKRYIAAGADTLYAPTFGANGERLRPYFPEEQTGEINQKLAGLTLSIAEGRPVGGNLSPTGIQVGPDTDHTFSELRQLYKEQASALKEAGVDYFVIETMTSLTDARAAVLACRRFGLPILVSMSVDEEGYTDSGTSALTCLVVLQELGIDAFGLNCTLSPAQMVPIFEELIRFAKVPLLAKPAAHMPKSDESDGFSLKPEEFASQFQGLFQAGVTLAGGCCGTTPEHISALRTIMDRFDFSSVTSEKNTRELVLTSVHETFSYDLDTIEFSPTLHPSGDMTDEFMELENDNYDIISVRIETPDEAVAFAENDHMSELPVSFLSSDPLALKTVLLLYSGRAMVDSRSEIDDETLQTIAKKYGAVVY